jgi:hypothetical protein
MVRQVALQIDIASGRISDEQLGEALNDHHMWVKSLALETLIERGVPVDDRVFESILDDVSVTERERLRREKMLHEDEQVLQFRANWYLPWGHYAYEALGLDHFETFGGQIRRDLRDDFEMFRTESADRIRERFGEEGVSKLVQESPFADANFRQVALSVLGERGGTEDAELVVSQLADGARDVRIAALRALRRLDTVRAAKEAQRLALDDDLTDNQREEAARDATELSPDTAFALTESAEVGVLKVAVSALPDTTDGIARMKEFLHADDPSVREAATKRLGAALSRDALEQVLREYTAGRYYYNVVVWLDRLLYCPEPFLGRYLAH